MARKTPLIIIDSNQWHVALPGDDHTPALHTLDVDGRDISELAEQVRKWLDDQNISDTSVTLAVDSLKIFSATISLDDLPQKHRRQTMMYRLEERLPVPAEEIVAQFIEFDDHATALAVETKVITPIIDVLESLEMFVEQVCSSTLLASRHYLDTKDAPAADLVICQHDAWVEIIQLKQGRLSGWTIASNKIEDIKIQLGLLARNQESNLTAICCDLQQQVIDTIRQINSLEITAQLDQAYLESVIAEGGLVAAGTKSPWVNFRRGQLAASDPYRQIRKPLNFVFAAAIIFLLSLGGTYFFRGMQYDTMTEQFEQQQLAEFHKTLPRQQVPASAVRSRLESEYRSIMRLRGQATDLPKLPSALEHLRLMITLLPENDGFDIDAITVKENTITLSGQAHSLTLANEISSSLQKPDENDNFNGFATELPKTELLSDNRVTFTIHGNIKGSSISGGNTRQ